MTLSQLHRPYVITNDLSNIRLNVITPSPSRRINYLLSIEKLPIKILYVLLVSTAELGLHADPIVTFFISLS
jgi:hypothetical protein